MSNVLFYVGVRCYHEVYGYGTIISNDFDNNKTRIRFDNGHEDNFNIFNLMCSPRFETFSEDDQFERHLKLSESKELNRLREK